MIIVQAESSSARRVHVVWRSMIDIALKEGSCCCSSRGSRRGERERNRGSHEQYQHQRHRALNEKEEGSPHGPRLSSVCCYATPAAMGLRNSVLSVCNAYSAVLTRGCHLLPATTMVVVRTRVTQQRKKKWTFRAFLLFHLTRPARGRARRCLFLCLLAATINHNITHHGDMRSLLRPLLLAC